MLKSKRWFLLMVVGFLLAFFSWNYFRQQRSGQVVTGIAQNPSSVLRSTSDRTNVAFFGIGGDGHVGGDLTDSIILFSYHHSTHALTLVPLPRDIWVPSLAAKINTAYHYGNEQRNGGGIDLAKSAVAEVTGLPVHYATILDFRGFEQMIDAVGGIDLTIPRTFDDYKYPIPGQENAEPEASRYEHLHFEAGPTHLDGATALKFARSRHSEGEEGTDFARSSRQEQVILAFKQKLLSSQTVFSSNKIQNLLDSLDNSLNSDANNTESGAFIRLFLDYTRSDSTSNSLDLSGLFYTPINKSPYQGQWVLIPKTSIEDIHAYVELSLSRQ